MPPGLLQLRAWAAMAPKGHDERTASNLCAGGSVLLHLLSPAALAKRPCVSLPCMASTPADDVNGLRQQLPGLLRPAHPGPTPDPLCSPTCCNCSAGFWERPGGDARCNGRSGLPGRRSL